MDRIDVAYDYSIIDLYDLNWQIATYSPQEERFSSQINPNGEKTIKQQQKHEE